MFRMFGIGFNQLVHTLAKTTSQLGDFLFISAASIFINALVTLHACNLGMHGENFKILPLQHSHRGVAPSQYFFKSFFVDWVLAVPPPCFCKVSDFSEPIEPY